MILVVDDNPKIFSSLVVAFPIFTFTHAISGEEAFDVLKKPHDFDIVILDVKMGGMSGLETLKKIKGIQPALPVIMMTGFGTRDVLIKALQNHADDYIDKPFDIPDVKCKILKLLDRTRVDRVRNFDAIERTKRFVRRNCERELNLNQAAEVAALSPKYLSRKFKKETNQSFTEYRVGIKMSRAQQLLRTTAMTISEVSDAVGYESPESFMKIFKRILGCTPTEYRKHKTKGVIAMTLFMLWGGWLMRVTMTRRRMPAPLRNSLV